MPTIPGFVMRLVHTGWDLEVQRRPHGTAHHRGRAPDVNRQIVCYTSARCWRIRAPVPDLRRHLRGWFERDGQVIGHGRSTRTISRRLRRALEHRSPGCAVPGGGATRGLHAHHIRHWEDGGPTDLDNLVLLCPYHHRLHHRGIITIAGPAHRLVVTDQSGRRLEPGSLARPPDTSPPDVPPRPGPTGERANWWWYEPFQPLSPPTAN